MNFDKPNKITVCSSLLHAIWLIPGMLLMATLCVSCGGVSKGQPKALPFEDKLVKAMIAKYSVSNAIPTNGVTVEMRNQILNDFIYLTDVNFHKFTVGLYQGRAVFDTTTDLAVLGLGAAGALTPAAGTKAILAAISGGIGGGRVSINKNFFHDQAATALISKMEAARKTKLASIIDSMNKLNATDYPLSRGLSDIADYYSAGTIIGALNDITATAGVEKAKAQDEIKTNMVTLSYQSDAATTALHLFWKPDGTTINKDNAAKIQAWMSTNGVNDISITGFLRSKEYADKRRKAMEDILPKSNP